MFMQSFDHFFPFLSILIHTGDVTFLYLRNRKKPNNGLFNFSFLMLLFSASLYFLNGQSLPPPYLDFINFERQSVFFK